MIVILKHDTDSIHDMGEQGELFSLLHSGPQCPAGFQVVDWDHDEMVMMPVIMMKMMMILMRMMVVLPRLMHDIDDENPGDGEQVHEAGQDGVKLGGRLECLQGGWS